MQKVFLFSLQFTRITDIKKAEVPFQYPSCDMIHEIYEIDRTARSVSLCPGEPDSGSVSLLGQNPCLIPDEEKRHVFALVEQQFTALPGSIRDQITLYDSSCTEADIREALTITGLSDVISGLPKGLDTPMDEKLFSKGQLQLLSIARALVSHPKVLLLDEITANLDADTEAGVIRALQASARGRTVISISHRLSQAVGKNRIIEIR
jgi:ATP-binding cassette subfamily B multidrug efflux pump